MFFRNTSGRLPWILSFFFELVLWRYSRNNQNIFQVIGFFLLLMSVFQTMKPRHVIKSSKQDETAIVLTNIRAWKTHLNKTMTKQNRNTYDKISQHTVCSLCHLLFAFSFTFLLTFVLNLKWKVYVTKVFLEISQNS